jgi:hypothetical protein
MDSAFLAVFMKANSPDTPVADKVGSLSESCHVKTMVPSEMYVYEKVDHLRPERQDALET